MLAIIAWIVGMKIFEIEPRSNLYVILTLTAFSFFGFAMGNIFVLIFTYFWRNKTEAGHNA